MYNINSIWYDRMPKTLPQVWSIPNGLLPFSTAIKFDPNKVIGQVVQTIEYNIWWSRIPPSEWKWHGSSYPSRILKDTIQHRLKLKQGGERKWWKQIFECIRTSSAWKVKFRRGETRRSESQCWDYRKQREEAICWKIRSKATIYSLYHKVWEGG